MYYGIYYIERLRVPENTENIYKRVVNYVMNIKKGATSRKIAPNICKEIRNSMTSLLPKFRS